MIVRGNSSDVIVRGNYFTAGNNADTWTPAQWDANGFNGIQIDGRCSVVSGNTVRFSRFGISVAGNHALVEGNHVDFFGDDGIRFLASNATYRNNLITNHYGKLSDDNHNDGMQGFVVAPNVSNDNIVLDGNVVLESTGEYKEIPPIPGGGGKQDSMQGISFFDGVWNNVTAVNNVVYISAYHGLTFTGANSGKIVNNTVITSNANPNFHTWIGVSDRKDGTKSGPILVRNNIVSYLNKKFTDHNIQATDPSKLFVKFDRANAKLDFHLLPSSPAVGAGLKDQAPDHDVTGAPRTGAIDIGAYAVQPVYTGSVTFIGSARQNAPHSVVLTADGVEVGKADVTADVHLGKRAVYTINFSASKKPSVLGLKIGNYTPQPKKNTLVAINRVTYSLNGQAPSPAGSSTSSGGNSTNIQVALKNFTPKLVDGSVATVSVAAYK